MVLPSPSPLLELFQRQKHSAVSLLSKTSLIACKSLSWIVNTTRESAGQYPAHSTEPGLGWRNKMCYPHPCGTRCASFLVSTFPETVPQRALPTTINTGQTGRPKWIWITFMNVLKSSKDWGLHITILCSSHAGKSSPHFPWDLYVLTIKEENSVKEKEDPQCFRAQL